MRADYSRWSFDLPEHYQKHYAGVLDLMGRLWVDADWNEEVLTRLFFSRQHNRDIIGLCGTPASPGTAFQIEPIDGDSTFKDFQILGGADPAAAGHFYVDGLLAQLENSTTFGSQADFPGAALPFDPASLTLAQEQSSLVYLEVWYRQITFLEDDCVREVALGGPDTTTRLKTIAQVKIALDSSNTKPASCEDALALMPGDGSGTLTTTSPTPAPAPAAAVPDPCKLSELSDYTGSQNRLYRVEIHEAGDPQTGPVPAPSVALHQDAEAGTFELHLEDPLAIAREKVGQAFLPRQGRVLITVQGGESKQFAFSSVSDDNKVLTLAAPLTEKLDATKSKVAAATAKIKWSSENAAFAVRVTEFVKDPAGKLTLTVASLSRDSTDGFHDGQTVEISNDTYELVCNRGLLTTINGEPNADLLTLVLADSVPQGILDDITAGKPVVLRRWDGTGLAHSDQDLSLSDGVNIRFDGYDFRAGDYWQFAARVANGTVEKLDHAPPMGIRRHRCPLALLRWSMEHDWDKDQILRLFTDPGHVVLSGDPLAAARQELEKHPNQRHVQSDIVKLAKSHGATRDALDDLNARLTAPPQGQPVNLHLHVDDCRPRFQSLTELSPALKPWPFLKYVGGDGQEADRDGNLDQDLQVAVFKASEPLHDATVQFQITTGNGGTLNGAASPISVKTDDHGIVTCKWKLAADSPHGQAPPPERQRVEVTLTDPPNAEAPIRFNAQLSTPLFCYVGGDGQEAGSENRLPKPLQVAVFIDEKPVPGMNVQFTIMDNQGGKLAPGPNDPLHDSPIPVVTNPDGVAECYWMLDPKHAFEAQTVEARLLDSLDQPILQPIHFNATIEGEDGIKIQEVILSQTKRDLLNDSSIQRMLLLGGIDLKLDRELDDHTLLNSATCYLTIEVPCSLLGDPLNTLVGAAGSIPIVMSGTPALDGSKKIIQWRPARDSVQKLLGSLADSSLALLARLTVVGNFIRSPDNLYLDGETFDSGDSATGLTLPSGDGRRGGDFRLWFRLERSSLSVDPLLELNLGSVPVGTTGAAKPVTLTSTSDVTITRLAIDPDPAIFQPTAPAVPFTVGTGGSPKTITIAFAPSAVGPVAGTLTIEGQTDRDSYVINLKGQGT